MTEPAHFWADPRLVYTVATTAVALLLISLWLFGRRQKKGRQAAFICLVLSIGLHIALFFLVPLMQVSGGGTVADKSSTDNQAGVETVEFSAFDPDAPIADASGSSPESHIAPLPVPDLTHLLQQPTPPDDSTPDDSPAEVTPPDDAANDDKVATRDSGSSVPASLAAWKPTPSPESMGVIDSELSGLLEELLSDDSPAPTMADPAAKNSAPSESNPSRGGGPSSTASAATASAASSAAPSATVPGELKNDFASRVGKAKEAALLRTGGNAETEAAVDAALKFLADAQRADGAWDPRASGAGRENRMILGVRRPGTGLHAESALTGLALLAMMGAGQTHLEGDYADNVYRGLAYLIRNQKPNGSLAGEAAPYAANYSHGMAALAMCEAAAITEDASAIAAGKNAVRYTLAQQHPTTGGWRYLPGDPGDLSQLGWQAMVLDAGYRAQISVNRSSVAGIQRFLRSVRSGQSGGLACYRRSERPSRTMTAEALATRLLIGDNVPQPEIAEAERFLLQQPPGVGQDNYYYWYYATIALHQLQDDAWKRWNEALQRRLLATQQSGGSWSSNTVWGGYGGTVYSTSMATLCLEAYYRHALRSDADRIANRPLR